MNFLRKIFGAEPPREATPEPSAPSAPASNDGSTPGLSSAPAELEEQSELLPASAPALANGTKVVAPDGAILCIEHFLEARGDINVYVASEASESKVRLREAGKENAASLEREFEVRGGGEDGSTPGLNLFERDGKTFLADALPPETPTLAALFAEGAPLETTLPLILQAARIVAQLHARGWMHGGLRPEIINAAGGETLTDFSSARPLGETLAAPLSHGDFSAPELAQPNAVTDARADVFSLGALFYCALAGAPLSQIHNDDTAQQRIFALSGVPQILTRALGAPETRFADAALFHEALARWAARRAPQWEYSSAVASVIGLNPSRTANEDAALFLGGGAHSEEGQTRWAMIAVADGMGGMDAGEVASHAATRSLAHSAAPLALLDELPDEATQAQWTKEWAQSAAAAVARAMRNENARGGCTLVFALVFGNRCTLAHAGDCRAYLFSSQHGHWEILTRDHSYVATLWQAGEIEWEELRTHPNRNQITRALGDKENAPDWFFDSLETATGKISRALAPGEVLLLCSDGAWEPVLESEMAALIQKHFPDLSAAANAILNLALARGAPDNATVALLTASSKDSPC